MTIPVQVKRFPHSDGLALPAYATPGAAGMDLLAAVTTPLTLAPGQRILVPTGLAIALPPGYELQVRPRSGLALKHGVALVNSPGTIDADYRGELKVLLINTDPSEAFVVARGERIAQLVVQAVEHVIFVEVDDLDDTDRGDGGFGHTGR